MTKMAGVPQAKAWFTKGTFFLFPDTGAEGKQNAFKQCLVGTGPNTVSGARFHSPNSVRFSGLTEFQGANSVSSSQPIICVPKRYSPSSSQNSPSLPQNSVRLSEFSPPKQYSHRQYSARFLGPVFKHFVRPLAGVSSQAKVRKKKRSSKDGPGSPPPECCGTFDQDTFDHDKGHGICISGRRLHWTF